VRIAISRSTALVAVGVALALLALVGPRLARTGAADEQAAASAEPLEPVTQAPVHSHLVVHVVGEVRRPGLYRLREGARIADAVRRAGGARPRADLAALNLAAPLVDGVQVLVPRRATGSAGSAPAAEDTTAPASEYAGAARKPSLATATAEQLDELPGVGPITAQKILDYRAEHGPFRSVDDLDLVPGIGPATVEELRDLVTP
jgi:competence protein ComEA